IKPVNPKQILLTCKRLLEGSKIREQKASQDYMQAFGRLSSQLGSGLDIREWIDVYQELIRYDLELEGADEGVRQILGDQYREANAQFGRFVEQEYAGWIADAREGKKPVETDRPVLSHEVMPTWVLPELKAGSEEGRPVVFFLIDCMRYDQWLTFERLLFPLFEVQKDWHVGLLPTATPYSRNAIFSGLLPMDIAGRFPQYWRTVERDEDASLNMNEPDYLKDLLKRKHLTTADGGGVRMRYEKLVSGHDGASFAESVTDYLQHDLAAVVVNFVDILAHSRSDSSVLKEIAPDVPAYRALTATWFEHSWLYQAFQELARHDVTIVITTDHGAIRSLHATKVIGDRDTSTSLRYKHGRNLKVDTTDAILVKDPETYGLPRTSMTENYIFAKEDYYFVYPTNYNRYLNQYKDTFQHGGVSLEEMLLPVITLRPRG
ncbi:MAG: PglZ domain-containing protein, partial [Rhodothermaceae bacterium]|nr:PglZ domain-containing protein [Rhodothermaceae bacterium]